MKIIIATKNSHKVKEIREIFQHDAIDLSDLKSFPEIPEAVEDGKSFRENALIKAGYYHERTGMPVIADDSGLVVHALDGMPGIYSARYAGPASDYVQNNIKLLDDLANVPAGKRGAFFVCYAVYWDGREQIETEGRIDGHIGFEARGGNGFGYDPLFFAEGYDRTLAELPASEKNRISHRYRAFSRLRDMVVRRNG